MEEQEIFPTRKFFLIEMPQAPLYILNFIHVESCEKISILRVFQVIRELSPLFHP